MNAATETTIIVPRPRNLGGGFEVRRALPSRQRRTMGPFVFVDQMGPTIVPAGTGCLPLASFACKIGNRASIDG